MKRSSRKGKGEKNMKSLQTRPQTDIFDALDDFFRPMFYDEKLDSMRTDIRETDKSYELEIELPGFKKNEISISLDNGYLTVDAEKAEREEDKDARYLRKECRVSCHRSYYVGSDVEQENVKAKYENGILCLMVPKMQPKKPEVKTINID